jgi:hypothetical protein
MDSTVIIHFVGLVLFTTQTALHNPGKTVNSERSADDSPVVAIMPSVPGPDPLTFRLKNMESGGAETSSSGHIEDHVALIAFKACDLMAFSGWEVKQLDSDFLYIQLKHDIISFAGDSASDTLQPPTLGHLGGHLREPYGSPPYSGASAVFVIPNGKLTACKSDKAQGRIDTNLTLANHGTITINADGKSITFAGNAEIVAMNVPWLWATLQTGQPGVKHYMVYCAMAPDSACHFETMKPNPLPSDQCDNPNFKTTSPSLPKALHAIDQYCSTTGWP